MGRKNSIASEVLSSDFVKTLKLDDNSTGSIFDPGNPGNLNLNLRRYLVLIPLVVASRHQSKSESTKVASRPSRHQI